MEVLDIVQSAAFKSGIISSFNPDELPDDVLKAGIAALTNEILPSLNCDRTIDITVTSRTYVPTNNRIVLCPFKQPADNFVILGHTHYTAKELHEGHDANGLSTWGYALQEFNPGLVHALAHSWNRGSEWPVNDFSEYTTFAMWSTDMHLVYSDTTIYPTIHESANIDFPPMRVDAVLEEGPRIPYEYKYRDEFEQAKLLSTLPGIYTTEEYDDRIIILLNGTPAAKCLILPVPLQIVNSDYAHPGTIKAPEKFRRYLIDCTAVSLAIIYGVSTVQAMQQQAAVSYNLLKKNKPQPLHEADVREEVAQKLRRYPFGGRFYANI